MEIITSFLIGLLGFVFVCIIAFIIGMIYNKIYCPYYKIYEDALFSGFSILLLAIVFSIIIGGFGWGIYLLGNFIKDIFIT